MADNVSNQSVANDIIGADEVDGIKYQQVKLVTGEDGEVDGNVSRSNPIPSILGISRTIEYGGSIPSEMSLIMLAQKPSGVGFILEVSIGSATASGVLQLSVEYEVGNSWVKIYQAELSYTGSPVDYVLPALMRIGLNTRYLIKSTLEIPLQVTRTDYSVSVDKLIQRIETNPGFNQVGMTSEVMPIDNLNQVMATVSEVTTGGLGLAWEMSNDLNLWVRASATQLTSSNKPILIMGNVHGFNFARLVIVSAVANSSAPAKVTLKGLV